MIRCKQLPNNYPTTSSASTHISHYDKKGVKTDLQQHYSCKYVFCIDLGNHAFHTGAAAFDFENKFWWQSCTYHKTKLGNLCRSKSAIHLWILTSTRSLYKPTCLKVLNSKKQHLQHAITNHWNFMKCLSTQLHDYLSLDPNRKIIKKAGILTIMYR